MSNSTSCSSNIPKLFFEHSCSVSAKPGSSLNQFSALSKCCPAPAYIHGFGDSAIIGCYAYCNTTSTQAAKEAESCIKDYFSKLPESTTEWRCDTADTADTGAAMRGRACGWSGLVMLGLVVSAAATML